MWEKTSTFGKVHPQEKSDLVSGFKGQSVKKAKTMTLWFMGSRTSWRKKPIPRSDAEYQNSESGCLRLEAGETWNRRMGLVQATTVRV